MNNLNHNCYTLSRNSNRCDVCGARLPRLIDADRLVKTIEKAQMESRKVNVLSLIHDAPTVEERPKGKWIIDGHHIRCNRCNEYICNTDREGNKIPDNFCPNCGAKMDL